MEFGGCGCTVDVYTWPTVGVCCFVRKSLIRWTPETAIGDCMAKGSRTFGVMSLIVGAVILTVVLLLSFLTSAQGYMLTGETSMKLTIAGILGFGILVLGLYEIFKG